MIDTSHLHPMLVHFPIALTAVGLALEFLNIFSMKTGSKFSCGEILLYIATASAVFSLLSGFVFTPSFSGKALEIRNIHMIGAVSSTIALFIASSFYLIAHFKNRKFCRFVGLIFYLISALFVCATGYFGGNLVYSYMIGL